MDEIKPAATKAESDVADANLPEVMASLEMLTVNNNLSPQGSKRILRKRIPRIVPTETVNRRCSLKPKKRKCSEMESDDDVKEYYLDKSLKKGPNNLETIYEEKDDISENTTFMSAKRYKRMIQFQQRPTDSKLKKRRAKIKKVFGSNINCKRRCASMQMLLDKLNSIRGESPAKVDGDIK